MSDAGFNPEMVTMARDRMGLSRAALSRSTRIPPLTLARIESGLVAPTAEHVARLAAALDRPASYFALPGRMYGLASRLSRPPGAPR